MNLLTLGVTLEDVNVLPGRFFPDGNVAPVAAGDHDVLIKIYRTGLIGMS